MIDIVPSLLSANFADLKTDLISLKESGVEILHYDVMDGHFVPNISFGPDILKEVTDATDFKMDVHLMISDPAYYVDRFIDAGASSITFHIETMESVEATKALISHIQERDVKAALAINPGTSYQALLPFLDQLDMVLVMSVQPGFGGQKFNPVALEKIQALSSIKEEKKFIIEVDGGINDKTIRAAREAGCDLFVAGSYVFKNKDRALAIRSLR